MALFSMWNQPETNGTKVYQKCSPSVAKIDTLRRGPLGYKPGIGSAFVWDTDLRLLATCHHVIHGAVDISATFDDDTGTSYKAKVVLSDPNKDLALLRVDAPKGKLRPITAGNSVTVRVGDEVLVIGSPFGLDNSLTHGIISQLGRRVPVAGPYDSDLELQYPAYQLESAIQIDANTNPGNSGGPLIDRFGQVIGMNSCIKSSNSGTSTGVGFVIPVNTISEFFNEPLSRHHLGIGSQCPMDIPNSDIAVCTMVSGSGDMKLRSGEDRPNSRIESPPYQSIEGSGDSTKSTNGMCGDVWSCVLQVSIQAYCETYSYLL